MQRYAGIDENQLHDFRNSEVYGLMPLLRKEILHTTNIEGYIGIRQTGKILPNMGDLPRSYPQSESYFGGSKGWLCLFDFQSAREEDYIRNHHLWSDFFTSRNPRRGPATIIIQLNRRKLIDRLIPNSARPKPGEPNYRPAIAYVEVWYPEAIPTSFIVGYIVTWRNHERQHLEFRKFSKQDIDKLEKTIAWIQQPT